jgi:hypothetical protein
LRANDGARAFAANADDDVAAAAAGGAARFSYGVIKKQAALKDQRYRVRVNLGCAVSPRACEAEPSDALRDQTDPLAPPAGRRRHSFLLNSF